MLPDRTENTARRSIVLATQGRGDLAALQAALNLNATYIGFVASQRKFATLQKKLQAAGAGADQTARIKAPAGLDIHAITPEEIALSIVAEIIQLQRSASTSH